MPLRIDSFLLFFEWSAYYFANLFSESKSFEYMYICIKYICKFVNHKLEVSDFIQAFTCSRNIPSGFLSPVNP